MFPPSLSLTGQLAPVGERGAAMGGFNTFGSLGFALGPLVGGFLLPVVDFSGTFIIGGLTVLILAAIATLIYTNIKLEPK